MNYEELIENVPAWDFHQNDQLVRFMPQVIRRAEKRVRRELEQDAFKAITAGSTSDETAVIDLRGANPVAVRYIRLVVDGTRVPLSMRGLEFLDALYPDPANKGLPAYYGETESSWVYELFPAPESVWTWQAIVIANPPLLSRQQPTNIVTERFGNLLEEACMLYAARFLKDWALWDKIMVDYTAELALANAELTRSRRDETETRPRETTNERGS